MDDAQKESRIDPKHALITFLAGLAAQCCLMDSSHQTVISCWPYCKVMRLVKVSEYYERRFLGRSVEATLVVGATSI